jgi:hypothetical protein
MPGGMVGSSALSRRAEPGAVPLDPVKLILEDFGRRDGATPDRRGDVISAGPA